MWREYGDGSIVEYDLEEAKDLSTVLKGYNFVFKVNYIDYQTVEHLYLMVEDGVEIIKVELG